MTEEAAPAFDKPSVRRSFGRAGGTYDAAAVLQNEVRSELLQRLDLTTLTPQVVLDAGAGTGAGARALKVRYPKARVIALDSALGMLRTARGRRSWLRPISLLCADAEHIPLRDGSVDLIVSNFMLQWCDPDAAFAEFRRVLAPQGFLSFSSLGPDTLHELRSAWQQVDPHSHVSPFIDMHDLGDALVRAGFVVPVLDVERYTLSYTDVRRLAADLKAVGAHNATQDRPKGLTGPRKFAAMQSAYEAFRRDGRLPATYEVVFGQAWAPAAIIGVRARGGEDSTVSLAEFQRQLKSRRPP